MGKLVLTAVLITLTTACAGYHKKSAHVQAPAPEPAPVSAKAQVAAIQADCVKASDAMKQRQAAKPLYERLGNREGIQELTTRIYSAHVANERIGHMFANVSREPFIQRVTDFLVLHSGGGGTYHGRDMVQAHAHLNISYEDFLAAGGDVTGAMKSLELGDEEIQEAVCFLVSFVPQVIKS